jgi:hypothetical protein
MMQKNKPVSNQQARAGCESAGSFAPPAGATSAAFGDRIDGGDAFELRADCDVGFDGG